MTIITPTGVAGINSLTSSTTNRIGFYDVNGGSNLALLVGSGSSTGTASQTLQVTGGAYVSGSMGIGVTSPNSQLNVSATNNAAIELTATAGGPYRHYLRTQGNDLQVRASSGVIQFFNGNSDGLSSTEVARIDSSGRLLLGTSTSPSAGQGQYSKLVSLGGAGTSYGNISLGSTSAATSLSSGDNVALVCFTDNAGNEFARIACAADSATGASDFPGRLEFYTTADGASTTTERMRIRNDGTVKFETINIELGGVTTPSIFRTGANGSGIHFTTNGSAPTNETGTVSDNTESWGISSYRWSVIYAATGTINTSDANEKQDIQDLSPAELAVAKELKNLFKTFKWKNAVAEKGNNARIHVGVIAQDVQQLFADHGLDVTKYGLWCSDTWYEVDGIAIASDGTPYTADSEGAVAKTRLGIRYEELLAFVLAAL